jgi:hypothetical protein
VGFNKITAFIIKEKITAGFINTYIKPSNKCIFIGTYCKLRLLQYFNLFITGDNICFADKWSSFADKPAFFADKWTSFADKPPFFADKMISSQINRLLLKEKAPF